MESYSTPEINQILSETGNDKCIDCNSPNPKWVSINNSIFLCSNCARVHNTLGESISKVKSLEVDSFTPEEIKLMKIGGNARFNALMAEYAITLESSNNTEFKYHLKVADYYRKLLILELNKDNNLQEYQDFLFKKPQPEEALQLLDSVQAEPAQEESELKKDVFGLFSKVGAGIAAVGGVIAEKAHQIGIDEKIKQVSDTITGTVSKIPVNPTIKNAGTKTIEVAKMTGEFLFDQTKKVYNSQVVQNLAKKAEEQYVNIKRKTNDYISKKNEEPNQSQPNPPNPMNMSQPSNQSTTPQMSQVTLNINA